VSAKTGPPPVPVLPGRSAVDATRHSLYTDDLALLKFGERMILQIMFGEESIKKKADACDALVARRQEQNKLREELGDDES